MKKKIQVILSKDISDTIKKYETINVKKGYAFNYLIPNKLAQVATKKKIKHLKILQSIQKIKQEKEFYRLKKIKTVLENIQTIYINKKIGDNYTIFGSIVEKEITQKTTEYANINIEKKQIQMPIVKKIGIYDFNVNLYGPKNLSISINIIILPYNI
uniref:Large ribosomal subunit protein bL9c n=1 Tax=Platysiphonia delicata TaxID=2006979 RepID=A0A1Z1M0S9_9FLOR|nr:ribosomal protein L9 [Platysiphonia delicata]ARW59669.1 ribosomal protein L9 [Platysiphonia delicata]